MKARAHIYPSDLSADTSACTLMKLRNPHKPLQSLFLHPNETSLMKGWHWQIEFSGRRGPRGSAPWPPAPGTRASPAAPLLEGLTASYSRKATLQELATFDGRRTVFVVWANFNYVSNCKCSQHCSHLGNDCPIIIVKGEADREYTSRVLAHIVYFPLQCMILGIVLNYIR
jgi:hypothetical protein